MDQFELATERAERRRATQPMAVAARYDPDLDRVIIELSTGAKVEFPPRHAQGLEAARPSDLDVIEVSPSGFGLHFPKLDADLWLPALLDGVFGSRSWNAARLGARGGRVKSKAKARAARINGKRGGRPRKVKWRRKRKLKSLLRRKKLLLRRKKLLLRQKKRAA
jgi:hypothetical protein